MSRKTHSRDQPKLSKLVYP